MHLLVMAAADTAQQDCQQVGVGLFLLLHVPCAGGCGILWFAFYSKRLTHSLCCCCSILSGGGGYGRG